MQKSLNVKLLNQDTEFELLIALLPFVQNKSYIDIGAEKGTVARVLIEAGFQGYLFEPLPKHFQGLKELIQETNSQFFPYAIDVTDGEASFHIACDDKGDPLDYFHSLQILEGDARVKHQKSIPVVCRSLDSLVKEGTLESQIGILKTDTEGNDLHVLQGMGSLRPEVIMCEFFTEGIYNGWEQGEPKKLIQIAQNMGYEHYIAITRWNKYELTSFSPTTFSPQQWGNIVFLNNDIFKKSYHVLKEFVHKSAAACYQSLWEDNQELTHICEERLELLNQVTQENQELARVCNERLELLNRVTQENQELVRVCNERLELLNRVTQDNQELTRVCDERLELIERVQQEAEKRYRIIQQLQEQIEQKKES